MVDDNVGTPTMKDARGPEWTWPTLAAYTLFLMWAAHACVFFAHEYAHSFTAWLLGWKSNPLALHYPRPTPVVLLLQFGICPVPITGQQLQRPG